MDFEDMSSFKNKVTLCMTIYHIYAVKINYINT